MDFEKFKKINDTRPNYGEIEDASVVSFYRNHGCGDGYRIFLKVERKGDKNIIRDASFTTTGCGFSMVALSMGMEWIKGKTIDEAETITEKNIEELFEFPEKRKNYPISAAEAIRKAIDDYKKGKSLPFVSRAYVRKKIEEQGNLQGENLSQVVLEKENLRGIDFSHANLQGAFLQFANLESANFENANLRGAFLNGANLRNANFRNADLRFAKLVGANIEGAIFDGALYDIGTRLDPKQLHIFHVMRKQGREIHYTR